MVRARALGFRLDGRRLAAIRTDAGEFPADTAIVCAGAYSKPLAAALGFERHLVAERGGERLRPGAGGDHRGVRR